MARKKVVGYIRVSTAEQVNGFGLGVQADAIRRHAKAKHWDLVATLRDEGISGSNGLDTRQGLGQALAMIEAGEAEKLVVFRLDRLARDLLLQETTIARLQVVNAEVVSVTEPDIDSDDHTRVLVRQVLGAIAQYERALIKGRMQAGKHAKAATGGYIGGAPAYGQQARDRQLVGREDEAPVVEIVRSLRAKGESYRSICIALTDAGYRPRRAETWQPAVVRRIAIRA